MPVYIMQEQQSNYFKIGRTAGALDATVHRLHAGNPRALIPFGVVQTRRESACEAFFHRLLRPKRVLLGGGTEFFEVEPSEMKAAISRLQSLFEELETAKAAVQELSKQESSPAILDATKEDRDLLGKLASLRMQRDSLDVQIELAEAKIKLRIGTSSGLRGVATWRSQVRRNYSENLFRQAEATLYEEILERYHCIDTTKWKQEDPQLYTRIQTTHFTLSSCRAFKLQA